MEYRVGITLALLFCGAAAWLGMDRERVLGMDVSGLDGSAAEGRGR